MHSLRSLPCVALGPTQTEASSSMSTFATEAGKFGSLANYVKSPRIVAGSWHSWEISKADDLLMIKIDGIYLHHWPAKGWAINALVFRPWRHSHALSVFSLQQGLIDHDGRCVCHGGCFQIRVPLHKVSSCIVCLKDHEASSNYASCRRS